MYFSTGQKLSLNCFIKWKIWNKMWKNIPSLLFVVKPSAKRTLKSMSLTQAKKHVYFYVKIAPKV